jgi:hypothetical protein
MPTLRKELYYFGRDLSEGNHKTLVIPHHRFWSVSWAHVRVKTTKKRGQRLLNMRIELPGDERPIARAISPVYQPHNTVMRYQFFSGLPVDRPDMVHNNNVVYIPLPTNPTLIEDWILHVEDMNNIDENDHVELRGFVALQERESFF